MTGLDTTTKHTTTVNWCQGITTETGLGNCIACYPCNCKEVNNDMHDAMTTNCSKEE